MKLCGKNIKIIAYDFDGVMTDNKAFVFSNGDEAVIINRSDGLAVKKIKSYGIKQIIISTEKNPVVIKRAEKLNIHVINGVDNKLDVLITFLSKHNNIKLDEVAFVGNDLNDMEIMKSVGVKISPFDAAAEILKLSDYVTPSKGGDGVIRDVYRKIYEEN
ncbi:MAG: haloacid dehalogenase [Flavobacteriaceae bacterium TMED238]|nr:MAG: haloacid dehalogenase [Flavobacteriaceae bacterium TMED238]